MSVPALDARWCSAIFVNATIGVIVLDPAGRFVRHNEAFSRMIGYTAADLAELTITDITHPDERPASESLLALMRQGAVSSAPSEKRYVRRDGSEVWVRLALAITIGTDGHPAHFVALAEDITDRRATEEALRRSESRFRRMVEHAADGIGLTDLDGNFRMVNQSRCDQLGYTRDELLAMNVRDIVESTSHDEAELDAALRRGETITFTARHRRKDDTRFPVEVTLGVLEGDDEPLVAGIVRDLTEREHAEARLRQAERLAAVGQLAAGVAHEINNPLTYVTANLYVLETELDERRDELPPGLEQTLSEAVAEARHGAERVQQIVRDLKGFARPDDDKVRSVDVEALLDGTLNLASAQLKHRATVARDYGDVPHVRGSDSRLGQVFLNLIINAAQAMSDGSPETHELRVSTRAEDAEVAIEIADTGCGMSAEALEHAFEPFYTTKAPGIGTGLGLTITHNLIESMGGRIVVESQPSIGTRFRISLPRASDERVSSGRQRAVRITPATRARVLVVDDDAAVGAAMSRLLAGNDVTVTTSGADAIERCATGGFDMVLCDLMMPEVTGMDVYETVLQTAPRQAARFVFMTGGAVTPRARRFVEEVARPCLDKPVDVQRLRDLLQLYATSDPTAP